MGQSATRQMSLQESEMHEDYKRTLPDAIKHPMLPLDTTLTYLNEGAANIVYRITIKCSTPQPSVLEDYGDGTPPPTELELAGRSSDIAVFDNKLLRLRKDLPTIAPCVTSQEAWERLIRPLFNPEQLVNQILVRIQAADLVRRLNDELQGWEGGGPLNGFLRPADPRPRKRHGTYLAGDSYGLLVTDMTPRHAGEDVVEFKPKWLVQSPSAPRDSKRCRTCALVARVNAKHARLGEAPRKTWCPLDLVSSNKDDLVRAAEVLLQPEISQSTIMRFADWLQRTSLLRRLRELQDAMDPKGVLDANIDDEKFRVAMTLRDCTVFVRFPEDAELDESAVEARLGDLDLKSKEKHEYWKTVERQLIDEGWYQGVEKEDPQPLVCSIFHN